MLIAYKRGRGKNAFIIGDYMTFASFLLAWLGCTEIHLVMKTGSFGLNVRSTLGFPICAILLT